jgi:hypothetical protein
MNGAPWVVTGLLWLSASAFADSVRPHDAVAGHSGLTYLDLMRLVVADLDAAQTQEEAKGRQIAPYRHVEGQEAKTSPAGPVWLNYINPLEIHADGVPRLAVLADLGPSDGDLAEFTLLALFDVAAEPKLLDVVEVGRDREADFANKPTLPLGHGSDLILVDSGHSDADISFDSEEILFVRGDRLQFVAALPIFANNDNCKFQLKPDRTVTTSPDPGSPYRQISAVVSEQLSLKLGWATANCDEQKPPRPFVRSFHATYRWDARRQNFVTGSKDLERLSKEIDRENAGRY